MQPFVVVSGLPASGKTTIAAALASGLGLRHLDKDTFLEALFETTELSSAALRVELSRQADLQFRKAALSEQGAVLSSWWRHPASMLESGTPIEWLVTSTRPIIEIHCSCSPAVAASRFLARRRHPDHHDERWSRGSLVAMLERQVVLGPLFPLQTITVSNEHAVDIQSLVQAILAKVREGSDA